MVKAMEKQNVNLSSITPPVAVSASLRNGSAGSNATAPAVAPSTASVVRGDPVFLSPKGVVDPQSGMYMLQYRDSSTGDVKVQYPSPKVVKAYNAGAALAAQPDSSQHPAKVEPVVSKNTTGGSGVH